MHLCRRIRQVFFSLPYSKLNCWDIGTGVAITEFVLRPHQIAVFRWLKIHSLQNRWIFQSGSGSIVVSLFWFSWTEHEQNSELHCRCIRSLIPSGLFPDSDFLSHPPPSFQAKSLNAQSAVLEIFCTWNKNLWCCYTDSRQKLYSQWLFSYYL